MIVWPKEDEAARFYLGSEVGNRLCMALREADRREPGNAHTPGRCPLCGSFYVTGPGSVDRATRPAGVILANGNVLMVCKGCESTAALLNARKEAVAI